MEDNHTILCIQLTAPAYPALLRDITAPPPALFVRGHLSPLPCLAIVGTRRASAGGKKIAYDMAAALARKGFCIISGLAFGIDGAAHQGCLDAGGTTGAVLAHGLDHISPTSHEPLAEKMLSRGGFLISQYPPHTPAYPNQFIARNRIIAGLALATIVIEAPAKSGSLATARFAAEQGKEVYVVPGPSYSSLYAGSHALIRDGARLIGSVQDLLEDLGITHESTSTLPLLDENESIIYAYLKGQQARASLETILQETHMQPPQCLIALQKLCDKGLVCEEGMCKYRIHTAYHDA